MTEWEYREWSPEERLLDETGTDGAVRSSDGGLICYCDAAYGRLIAAAPKLRQALVEIYEGDYGFGLRLSESELRALIAEAGGEIP